MFQNDSYRVFQNDPGPALKHGDSDEDLSVVQSFCPVHMTTIIHAPEPLLLQGAPVLLKLLPSMLRLHLRPIHHPVCASDIGRHSNLAGKGFSY